MKEKKSRSDDIETIPDDAPKLQITCAEAAPGSKPSATETEELEPFEADIAIQIRTGKIKSE